MSPKCNLSPNSYLEQFLGPALLNFNKELKLDLESLTSDKSKVSTKLSKTYGFIEGAKLLKQELKNSEWNVEFFDEVTSLLCHRYLENQDTSYRRSIIPIFQQIEKKKSGLIEKFLSQKLLTYLNCNLFKTASSLNEISKHSHLISCLLDFNIGEKVIVNKLEYISNWTRRSVYYYSSIETKIQSNEVNTFNSDAIFAFRNIAILASRFNSPLTQIPLEIENILLKSLTDSKYNIDAIGLISLALVTSLKNNTSSLTLQAIRINQILNDLFDDKKYQIPFYPFLSLCHNLVSTLNLDILVFNLSQEHTHSNLMFKIYNDCMSILCSSNVNSCRIQGTRVLSSWFNRLVSALKRTEPIKIETQNEFESILTNPVSFTTLQNYIMVYWIDTSDCLGETIRELFESMLNFNCLICSVDSQENLLNSLIQQVAGFDWHRKIRYSMLSSLLPHITIIESLQKYPELLREIFKAFQSPALATRASDCLVQMYRKILHESNNLFTEEEKSSWLNSICQTIVSNDNFTRRNVSIFLLPKLLKLDPSLFPLLLDQLDKSPDLCLYRQHGSVIILKAAKEAGISIDQKQLDFLKSSLFHSDVLLRNDMLSLISNSQKTTSFISSFELLAFRQFFPLNMRSACPDFRQKIQCQFIKFLKRVHVNIYAILRNSAHQKSQSDDYASLMELLEFLDWIVRFSLFSLYPGAPYQRSNSALKMLETYYQTIDWNFIYDMEDKLELSFVPITASSIFIQLASILTTQYDTNQSLAAKLLSTLPPVACIEQWKQPLMNWSLNALQSVGAGESTSGAVILQYLLDTFAINRNQKILVSFDSSLNKNQDYFIDPNNIDDPIEYFLISIINSIKLIFKDLNDSIQNKTVPVYGLFKTMQLFFATIDENVYLDNIALWKNYISICLDLIYHMFAYAQTPLTSVSPDDEALFTDEEEKSIPNRQASLSFFWRGVKEAASAIGTILVNLPEILIEDELEKGGLELQRLLTGLWHRGAFSALVPSYRSICSKLLKLEKRSLVINWLEKCLQKIVLAGSDTTQRSAGLPFCVITILNVLFEANDMIVTTFIQRFFILAQSGKFDNLLETVSGSSSIQSSVHGLNILRSVFQDSGIGATIFDSFGSRGLSLAVDGLGNSHWAIRNSSVLLFSALITRIFGIKRVRDEHDLRNRLTVKEFFSRFPEMKSFLLTTLEKTSYDTLQLSPSLFPALSLLSRLYTQPGEENFELSVFINNILVEIKKCASCPILKVRELAGQVMAALASDKTIDQIDDLLDILDISEDSNQIHGVLIQILELTRNNVIKERVLDVSQRMIARMDLHLKLTNTCDYSRATLFETWRLLCFTSRENNVGSDDMSSHVVKALEIRKSKSQAPDSYIAKLPLVQLFPSSFWLSDPDYEVRELCLELLPSIISSLSKACKKDFHEKVFTLIQMADIHLGTLCMALKVLPEIFDSPLPPSIFQEISPDFMPSSNLIKILSVFFDMIKVHFSFTVRSHSVRLLAAIFQQIGYVDSGNIHQMQIDISYQIKAFSDPNQDIIFRESTSKAIIHILSWMDSSNEKNISSCIVLNIFKTLVNLLQDDDEAIRNYVAQNLFLQGFLKENLCPEKALEETFKVFSSISSPDAIIPVFVEYLTVTSQVTRETFIPKAEKLLFEVERPNFHIEPLITVQLALHELLLLSSDSSCVLYCSKAIYPLFKGAVSTLIFFTELLKSTTSMEQVRFGGPLGLTGSERGFFVLYQHLAVISLTCHLVSRLPKTKESYCISIDGICEIFDVIENLKDVAFIKKSDSFIPIHPVITEILEDISLQNKSLEQNFKHTSVSHFCPFEILTTYVANH